MTIRVSDHALIRWLERAHGIDMEFFRRSLALKVEAAAALGATVLIVDGLHYCIRDGVLTTVRPPPAPLPLRSTKVRKALPEIKDWAGL